MKLVQYERPGWASLGFGRWPVFADELERLFEAPAGNWIPPLDVQEDANNYTVRTELPGLKREDINVSLHDGELVITGERKAETRTEGVEVHRQERYYGKFQRVLTLPVPVAADKIAANYKDGVLTIILPKTEAAKPKKIDVAVN